MSASICAPSTTAAATVRRPSARVSRAPRRRCTPSGASGVSCAGIGKGHPGAGSGKRGGDRIARIVAGGDDDPPPRHDAVEPQIMQRGLGRHDPGQVVVREPQRPLDGAGGEDGAARTDAPMAVGRTLAPFPGREQAMIEGAPERGVAKHPPARGLDRAERVVGEVVPVTAVDRPAAPAQRPAHLGCLVHQPDRCATARGASRSGEACRPGADDEDVAAAVYLGRVGGRLIAGIEPAKARPCGEPSLPSASSPMP